MKDFKLEEIMLKEEQMIFRAKDKVLSSTRWWVLKEIVNESGINEQHLRDRLLLWKIENKILSVRHNGVELFPSYAFDQTNKWNPHDGLALIIKSFKPWKTEWTIAIWLAGANGFLGGKRPQDWLSLDADLLKRAVADEFAGITHG